MRTLTKEQQEKLTALEAIQLLKDGNQRFLQNLKFNRNLLQQVNDTRNGQHPFAVIISCMDSRTSAELIFDQGLGDIFSIRIAGNVVSDEVLGSAEFGCKVAGAKVILVLGHTRCGAIQGALDDVELGYLGSITRRIQRCLPAENAKEMDRSDLLALLTEANVRQSIQEIRSQSKVLSTLEKEGKIALVGAIYDVNTGMVEFFDK